MNPEDRYRPPPYLPPERSRSSSSSSGSRSNRSERRSYDRDRSLPRDQQDNEAGYYHSRDHWSASPPQHQRSARSSSQVGYPGYRVALDTSNSQSQRQHYSRDNRSSGNSSQPSHSSQLPGQRHPPQRPPPPPLNRDRDRLINCPDFLSQASAYMSAAVPHDNVDSRPVAQFGKPITQTATESSHDSHSTPSPPLDMEPTSVENSPQNSKQEPSKIVMIKFPTSQTPSTEDFEQALTDLNIKYRYKKFDRGSKEDTFYLEFYHKIESISFMRKTKGMLLSEEKNASYMKIAECLSAQYDVDKYKIFTTPPADQEILVKEAIFILSVSIQTSGTRGQTQSPSKVSCFTNHGSCTFRLSEDPAVFVKDLNFLLINNLKQIGSSNRYDKAILQFYNWSEAESFLEWYQSVRVSGLDLADVIFTVTVVEPFHGQPSRSELSSLEYDASNVEEKAMAMHYLIDKKIHQLEEEKKKRKDGNDVPFINLDECLSIQKVFDRIESIRGEQILCFLVIWFRKEKEKQSISKIGLTVCNSKKKTASHTLRSPSTTDTDTDWNEKNLILDFLKKVDDFIQKNGKLPATLVCFSNPVTLSVLFEVLKRHSLEDSFRKIFSNSCDLQNIIDTRGKDQKLLTVKEKSSQFLRKMCTDLMPCESIFEDIGKYSRPFSEVLVKPLDPFPLELKYEDKDMNLSKGDTRTIEINFEAELLDSCQREDLRFKKNRKYPLFQMKPLVEDIKVKLAIRAEKNFTLRKGSLLGFFVPKPESFVIPSTLWFLDSNLLYTRTSMDGNFNSDLTAINFSISAKKCDGPAFSKPRQIKVENPEVPPGPPVLPLVPPNPPVLKLTKKSEIIKTKIKVEKTAVAPPPPAIHLKAPVETSVVKTEQDDVTTDDESQDMDLDKESEDSDPELNVFIYIENTGDQISYLDVLFSRELSFSSFERFVSVGGASCRKNDIPATQALQEMTDFLFSKIKRDRQTLRLVMMCPDSLEIFQSWVEKHHPVPHSFSKIFTSYTSLASLVNDHQVSGLLKGSKLNKDRLATYLENLTSTQLSDKTPKTEAMKKVFEKLNVEDDKFEATKLPDNTCLLFFFHVDIIDSEIVTLGYYTSNQQHYFTPLKLRSDYSEKAKKLGFVNKTTFKAKHSEEDIDCKDEKAALLDFLCVVEKHCNAFKLTPVFVSLNIREQVSKLFERFSEHGLLEKAFQVIKALASVEEFWMKTEKKSFRGLKDILGEKNSLDLDPSEVNSLMTSKLSLDLVTEKLSVLPNYENFTAVFGHSLRSPYVNKIWQDNFPEDRYKVISKNSVKLSASWLSIQVKILGSTNLERNSAPRVLMVESLSKKGRTELTSTGEFEITLKPSPSSVNKKFIKKEETIAFLEVEEKIESKNDEPQRPPSENTRYRVYTERVIDVKPGEIREMKSDEISKSLTDQLSVDIELKNDESEKYIFQYQKTQKLRNKRIEYSVKNISNETIKIPRCTIIGHLTISRPLKGNSSKSTPDLSKIKDKISDLKIKFPGYEPFISEAVQQCLEDNSKNENIIAAIEDAVMDIKAWMKKSPSEILEMLLKTLKEENRACDSSLFLHVFPDAYPMSFLDFVSNVFTRIIKTKYFNVKKEIKTEGVERDEAKMTPRNDTTSEIPKIRVKDFAKIHVSNSNKESLNPTSGSEYVEDCEKDKSQIFPVLVEQGDEREDSIVDHDDEYMEICDYTDTVGISIKHQASETSKTVDISSSTEDVELLMIGPTSVVLDGGNSGDTEANLVKEVDTSTESNSNSQIAAEYFPEKNKVPEETSINNDAIVDMYFPSDLPSPCPVKAKPATSTSVEVEVTPQIDVADCLPSPCPVIAKPASNAPVVEIAASNVGTDHEILENQNRNVSESETVERTIRRVDNVETESTKKSSGTKSRAAPRKIVFTLEPEPEPPRTNNNSEKYGFCPHFEDAIRQTSCLKCNGLRKGKVRCRFIINPKYSKEFCRYEVTKSKGCFEKSKSCKKNHDFPDHIFVFDYCPEFLMGACNKQATQCKSPHLKFGDFNRKLKEEINKIREHCKICEDEYRKEYQELMDEIEEERKKMKRKRQICKHFLQGRCNYGSDCFKSHDTPDLRMKLAKYS